MVGGVRGLAVTGGRSFDKEGPVSDPLRTHARAPPTRTVRQATAPGARLAALWQPPLLAARRATTTSAPAAAPGARLTPPLQPPPALTTRRATAACG